MDGWLCMQQCNSGINGQNSMSHNMENMDVAAKVGFFTIGDLFVGQTLKIQFFGKDPSALPPLLAKEEADLIPFSLNKFPQLLQIFSIHQGSYQAQLIQRTLKQCEFEPIEGEKELCATSLESMVEFVSWVFGLWKRPIWENKQVFFKTTLFSMWKRKRHQKWWRVILCRTLIDCITATAKTLIRCSRSWHVERTETWSTALLFVTWTHFIGRPTMFLLRSSTSCLELFRCAISLALIILFEFKTAFSSVAYVVFVTATTAFCCWTESSFSYVMNIYKGGYDWCL